LDANRFAPCMPVRTDAAAVPAVVTPVGAG
jgi:hypothetical protein